MSTRKLTLLPKLTLFYLPLIVIASVAVGMVIASRLDLSPVSSAQTITVPAMNSVSCVLMAAFATKPMPNCSKPAWPPANVVGVHDALLVETLNSLLGPPPTCCVNASVWIRCSAAASTLKAICCPD